MHAPIYCLRFLIGQGKEVIPVLVLGTSNYTYAGRCIYMHVVHPAQNPSHSDSGQNLSIIILYTP